MVHRSVRRLFLRCWLAEGGREKLESPLLPWFSTLPFPHRPILTPLTQTRDSWMSVQQVRSFRLWRGYTRVRCEICNSVNKVMQRRWLALPNQVAESGRISREGVQGCKKKPVTPWMWLKKKQNDKFFYLILQNKKQVNKDSFSQNFTLVFFPKTSCWLTTDCCSSVKMLLVYDVLSQGKKYYTGCSYSDPRVGVKSWNMDNFSNQIDSPLFTHRSLSVSLYCA